MIYDQYLTISELSTASGVPVSTIKYYIREGLLPKSIKTGKTMSFYSKQHLLQLIDIKHLKQEKKLPLKQIKIKLQNRESKNKYPDRSKTQNIDRRNLIVQSTTDLFRKKGFNNVSISDIVSHSGVGRATFYKYFKNKEDLFFECADKVFYDLDKEIVDIDTDDLKSKLLKRLIYFIQANPQMHSMLSLIKGLAVTHPAFKKKLDQIMKNLIQPLANDIELEMKKGTIKPINPYISAAALLSLTENLPSVLEKFDGTLEELFEMAWDAFYNGIKI